MSKILIFLIFSLPMVAGAQFVRKGLVKVRTMTATNAVHSGSEVKVVIAAEIAKGFHINDHQPTFEYLISTKITWDSHPDIFPGKMFYPAGEMKTFQFSKSELSVYEGTLLIGGSIKVSSGLMPGEHRLQGNLFYQACNETACFPPTRVPLGVKFRVVPIDVHLKHLHTNIFSHVKFK